MMQRGEVRKSKRIAELEKKRLAGLEKKRKTQQSEHSKQPPGARGKQPPKKRFKALDVITANFPPNPWADPSTYTMRYFQSTERKARKAAVVLQDKLSGNETVFNVGKELGAGTYGYVFSFINDNSSIAVKMPNGKWVEDDDGSVENDIKSEFKYLVRAYPDEGPYGLRLMHKEVDDSNRFSYRMMMPLVPGERLHSVIKQCSDVAQVALLVLRVAQELQRVHQTSKVIHGDIRPGNVLAVKQDKDFKVHFVDFDFAYRPYKLATQYGHDKNGYGAPEREGQYILAHPSQDVISLAATFSYAIDRSELKGKRIRSLYTNFPEIADFIHESKNTKPEKRPTLSGFIKRLTKQLNEHGRFSVKANASHAGMFAQSINNKTILDLIVNDSQQKLRN